MKMPTRRFSFSTGILVASLSLTVLSCANPASIDVTICTVDSADASPLSGSVVEVSEGNNPASSGTTEADGCVTLAVEVSTTSSIEGPAAARGFSMDPPYPNPVRFSTSIPVYMADARSIRLELYDVAGRVIANIPLGLATPGAHRVELNAAALSSGLYFYTLSSLSRVASGQFVKLGNATAHKLSAVLIAGSTDGISKRTQAALNISVVRDGYESIQATTEAEDGATVNYSLVREAIQVDFNFSNSGLNVFFQNLTQNADAYLWDFGDGTTSTLGNPSHMFPGSGDYTVQLVASTSVSSDSVMKTVSVSGDSTGSGDIWFAGHSYARNLEDMADLGADLVGYHGGEGFLADWYVDRESAIDPGFGREFFFFIEWLQLQSQVESSAAAASDIKAYLQQNGVSNTYVMVQWFQTEPACTRHGLTCGPSGQEWFNDLYSQMAQISGVILIPVGDAFVEATQLIPGISLHSDGSHASSEGEYLRNVTIFSFLTGVDARTLPDLGQANAMLLKQAAYNAING